MSHIVVVDRTGAEHVLDAPEGWRVMEIIRDHGLPIQAECGGCCACATCHVYVEADWQPLAGARGDEEEEMLDLAAGVEPTSRLSCQILFTPELAGLRLHLAPEIA